MLRNFKVLTPSSLNETLYVINSLKEPYRFLCGGTDVLVRLKDNPNYTKVLVDISRVPELSKIEEHKNTYIIGSTAKHSQVMTYEPFRKNYSALIDAVSAIGSPQIRSLGTIGGNIGNASPAGDSIPALMAFDAELETRSLDSNRRIMLSDFFLGPGKTVLAPNEIITKVIVPKFENYRSAWMRLGQRRGMAISKVSAAVSLYYEKHSNGSLKLNDIKIALGSVAPRVVRAVRTEKFMLLKQTINKAMIAEAAEMLMSEVSPITDVRSDEKYRRAMCGELFCEIIEKLVQK